MSFKNRSDAGRKLAARLAHYKGQPVVVLALPRGGVPVAAEVAAVLGAPIDLVLVRKIGVPMQPELAMGAIVDGDPPVVARNEEIIRLAGVDERSFEAVRDREFAKSNGGASSIWVEGSGSASRARSRSSSTMSAHRNGRDDESRVMRDQDASASKSSYSRCRSAPRIRQRRYVKRPMRSYASKSTRISARSAISTTISGKSRTKR